MATQYVVKCVEDCAWVASLYQGPTMYTKIKSSAMSFTRQKATELVGVLRIQSKMTKTYILEDA